MSSLELIGSFLTFESFVISFPMCFSDFLSSFCSNFLHFIGCCFLFVVNRNFLKSFFSNIWGLCSNFVHSCFLWDRLENLLIESSDCFVSGYLPLIETGVCSLTVCLSVCLSVPLLTALLTTLDLFGFLHVARSL